MKTLGFRERLYWVNVSFNSVSSASSFHFSCTFFNERLPFPFTLISCCNLLPVCHDMNSSRNTSISVYLLFLLLFVFFRGLFLVTLEMILYCVVWSVAMHQLVVIVMT